MDGVKIKCGDRDPLNIWKSFNVLINNAKDTKKEGQKDLYIKYLGP